MTKKYVFRYTFSTDDTIHTISKNFDSFENLIDFLYLSKSNPDFVAIEDISFDVIDTYAFDHVYVPDLFSNGSED